MDSLSTDDPELQPPTQFRRQYLLVTQRGRTIGVAEEPGDAQLVIVRADRLLPTAYCRYQAILPNDPPKEADTAAGGDLRGGREGSRGGWDCPALAASSSTSAREIQRQGMHHIRVDPKNRQEWCLRCWTDQGRFCRRSDAKGCEATRVLSISGASGPHHGMGIGIISCPWSR